MELIAITLIICIFSLVSFLIRVTYGVTRYDPMFALKAFASGFGSSLLGYLVHGYIIIKIVLWGIGGFIVYAIYSYYSNEP